MDSSNRSGTFIKQPYDYTAFIPKTLPPDPPLTIDFEIMTLLSKADRCLGRLDGITQTLPNPDLFVAMYVKKEAVLSSQIEGTQASLIDILDVSDPKSNEKVKDVEEVINYIHAMNYGLSRLKELPLSLRLFREIHEILLSGVRGCERSPGEFRSSQNWIGPPGCTLSTAVFVPPPPHEMLTALGELEKYFHSSDDIPPLIKIGLIHAQFETIHPFLDGNGRMGRLLITFWLCQQEILSQPLLYISYYFKMNKIEYYDRLMAVRKRGDWEDWIKFFLKGLAEVSAESTDTAKRILKMKEDHSKLVNTSVKNPANGLKLLEILFEHPVITINFVSQELSVSYPTANVLVSEFCELGILHHGSTAQRNRKYIYSSYVDILQAGTELTEKL
ncbi:MAG: MloA [Firmicutes bacterium]|nr:MloA [Bacillota bacterium]